MSTVASDVLRSHRLDVAASLRRLSDEALRCSERFADPDLTPEVERAAVEAVYGRVDGVKHARVLLDAARIGVAKGLAASRRGAAA